MTQMPPTSEALPPHSLPAERAVLASVLLDPSNLGDIADLAADDFFLPAHRDIVEAMRAIAGRGGKVEIIAVTHELERAGAMARVEGGQTYLLGLLDAVTTSLNLAHWTRIVRDTATCRRIAFLATQLRARAFSGADPTEMATDGAKELLALAGGPRSDAVVHLGDLMGAALDRIDKRAESKGDYFVPTGLHTFDDMVGGLMAENLIVVGGVPGMGKTAWAMNVAGHAVEQGIPTLIVSLEMSCDQLVDRWLARQAMVPAFDLITGAVKANNDAFGRVHRTAHRIVQYPLFGMERTRKLSRIIAECRRWHARQVVGKGHQLGLIAVDYLTLVKSDEKAERRDLEVGAMSREFKAIAQELKLPVVLLSQLSRGVAKEGRRPVDSDLRDAGAVEQDADVIVFPYREFPIDPQNGEPEVNASGEAVWIVSKNRHGAKGDARCLWGAPVMGFFNDEPGRRVSLGIP